MNYYEALATSGLGEKFTATNRARDGWGDISEEAMKLVLRCSKLEGCSPELLAFTWMEESSFRFFPEPNTDNDLNPDRWDYGPCQINFLVYIANVDAKYFEPLVLSDVFGSRFWLSSGITTSTPFNGNPYYNVLAAARWLARISKDPKGRTFDSTDAMKAGIYTGGDRVEGRAAKFTRWQQVFQEFFRLYVQPRA